MESRLRACSKLADLLMSSKEKLVLAAAEDAGFPWKITEIEIDLSVQHLKTMHEEIKYVQGKKPYGTVAAIFPYDAPSVMLARLGGAAILGGNRLRFSFSSLTPKTASIITELTRPFEELESVYPKDNREFGKDCIEDNEVRALFISGGSKVGDYYRSKIVYFDKIFFAGPGGMPAVAVFPDADPEKAATFITTRAFINGGQYCTTIKKALIHEDLYEDIKKRVLEKTDALKVGDPKHVVTDIGPIKAERTRALLQNALEQVREARILRGKINGQWIHPFVLESETVPDLELFGPLLLLKKCASPQGVVSEAIKTQFGFLLAFFGTPPNGARHQFDKIFGMVHDNPAFRFTPLRLPFGGRRKSGWIVTRNNNEIVTRDGAFIYSEELVKR